jgi:outer membrane protein assembly factor BamA
MRSRRLVQRVRSSTSTHPGVRVPSNSFTACFETLCVISLLVIFLATAPAILAQEKSQPPKTSPQTTDTLPSYEGQNVTTIEIAGQPDLRTSQFASDFSQHVGEPFSTEKLNETIANLSRAGKFDAIELQVDPEANGVRILLVLEPAYYFGIYQFPGAQRFSYPRLVQVTNYPPEAAYNADDIQQSTKKLTAFFQQEGYFWLPLNLKPASMRPIRLPMSSFTSI